MKQYEKKIESYQTLIQKGYVRESAVQNVMEQCAGIMSRQDDRRASYFEFLYEQLEACSCSGCYWLIMEKGQMQSGYWELYQ